MTLIKQEGQGGQHLRPEKRRKSAYRAVIGGGKVDHAGGRLLTKRGLNTVPPAIIHRVVSEPMDGVMDVQGGRISAGP